MKRFLVIFLDIISFGVTFLIRVLVKKKYLNSRYDIDINGDGNTDISIQIHSNESKHEKEE